MMVATMGLFSLRSTRPSIGQLAGHINTTPIHHSIIPTPIYHSIITTPIHHSITPSPIHHSIIATPIHHSIIATPIHHSIMPFGSPCFEMYDSSPPFRAACLMTMDEIALQTPTPSWMRKRMPTRTHS
jgi:hypothetical protein